MKLVKNFEENKVSYDSSMLRTGEMMEVVDSNCEYNGHILMRVYGDVLVSLTRPINTWDIESVFVGRKLKSGESVTLIQE